MWKKNILRVQASKNKSNVVNSSCAARMQFSSRLWDGGLNIQFTANLSDSVASTYASPPQIQGVMILFHSDGSVSFSFNADGDKTELYGICLDDGSCRVSDTTCSGGVCIHVWRAIQMSRETKHWLMLSCKLCLPVQGVGIAHDFMWGKMADKSI